MSPQKNVALEDWFILANSADVLLSSVFVLSLKSVQAAPLGQLYLASLQQSKNFQDQAVIFSSIGQFQFVGYERVYIIRRLYMSMYDLQENFDILKSMDIPHLYTFIKPFTPNVFSHPYPLYESITSFRVVGWYFSLLFKF